MNTNYAIKTDTKQELKLLVRYQKLFSFRALLPKSHFGGCVSLAGLQTLCP